MYQVILCPYFINTNDERHVKRQFASQGMCALVPQLLTSFNYGEFFLSYVLFSFDSISLQEL